jgi:hypothetical protein
MENLTHLHQVSYLKISSASRVSRSLTSGICRFIPGTFFLTRPPRYGSLPWLSQESGGKGRRQRKAKGTRQGEKARKWKKDTKIEGTNLAIYGK